MIFLPPPHQLHHMNFGERVNMFCHFVNTILRLAKLCTYKGVRRIRKCSLENKRTRIISANKNSIALA